MIKLDGELGQIYARALLAIAEVDGEVGPEEAGRLRELVAARTSAEIDYEASFFHKLTAAELATAVTGRSQGAYREAGTPVTPRDVGRALVADAVSLATVDGDLNSTEAHAILRFAFALGCTPADVSATTNELTEWLPGAG